MAGLAVAKNWSFLSLFVCFPIKYECVQPRIKVPSVRQRFVNRTIVKIHFEQFAGHNLSVGAGIQTQ